VKRLLQICAWFGRVLHEPGGPDAREQEKHSFCGSGPVWSCVVVEVQLAVYWTESINQLMWVADAFIKEKMASTPPTAFLPKLRCKSSFFGRTQHCIPTSSIKTSITSTRTRV